MSPSVVSLAVRSVPGIGNILGLTITLEVGENGRLASAGRFASYNRCVDANRLSNGKRKDKNNVGTAGVRGPEPVSSILSTRVLTP